MTNILILPGLNIDKNILNNIQKAINKNDFFTFEDLPKNIRNSSIDVLLHEYLLHLNEKYNEINSITIPISFTKSLFEFSGLVMAHHIRLTNELKFWDSLIVIYSVLDMIQLLKLSPLSRILLTKNTKYLNIIEYSFEHLEKSITKHVHEKVNIEGIIKQIQISPPANYETHHSVDNEITLIKWSKYIGCYDFLPDEFKKEFDSNLYFKYYQLVSPIKNVETTKLKRLESIDRTKILLIDDEAEKGWKTFYSHFFSTYIKTVIFETLDINYKALEQISIIEEAKRKIEEFDPDLVLLDLRLCDSDLNLEQYSTEKLTGYKILQEIKKFNKGIQVIIITASNKAWNFQATLRTGANGYIIKRGDSDVVEDINELKNLIEYLSIKSEFLKKVYSKIQNVKFFVRKNELLKSDDDSFRKVLFSNYEIIFELLEKASDTPSNEKYYNYAYLKLFHCIEEFLRIKSIFDYNDRCYVNNAIKVAEKISKDNESQRWKSIIKLHKGNPSYWIYEENENVSQISTDFKMSCVLIFLYNQENSNFLNWPNIREIRNKNAAHPEEGTVSKEQILDILSFQEYIFNMDNIQKSTKAGLPDNVSEENLQKLIKKFDKT